MLPERQFDATDEPQTNVLHQSRSLALQGIEGVLLFDRAWESIRVPLQSAEALSVFLSCHGLSLSTLLRVAWALVLRLIQDAEHVQFSCLFTRPASSAERCLRNEERIFAAQLSTIQARNTDNVLETLKNVEYASADAMDFESLLNTQSGIDTPGYRTAILLQRHYMKSGLDEECYANRSLISRLYSTLDFLLVVNFNESFPVISILYQRSRVSGYEAANVARTFGQILQGINDSPQLQFKALSISSVRDKERIWQWNEVVPPKIEACLHDLIEETVLKQPHALAICAWDGELTYEDVWNLSSRLGHHLITLGLDREMIVPILFEKSMWTTIAMLAVLKAGGAFVLLDSTVPKDRLQVIIHQVKAQMLLSSPAQSALGRLLLNKVVVVDGPGISHLERFVGSFKGRASPSAAAFVLFTSGSTGVPKGAVITHSNYSSNARYRSAILGVNSESRTFCFASHNFDISVEDIILTLLGGGCICVPSDNDRTNDFPAAFNRLNANAIHITPTTLSLISPNAVPGLRVLQISGEPLTPTNVSTWAKRVKAFGCYGPCECSIGSHMRRLSTETPPANLGRGVGAVTWIVDPEDVSHLMPIGSVGELLLEGPLVNRGYLNDPDKDATTYITNPEWLLQGSRDILGRQGRLYRTGDLVRYDTDGTIIIVGRKDTQVKLRGQRIELGEVEHHLHAHLPDSTEATAEIIRPCNNQNNPPLVAFICVGNSDHAAGDDVFASIVFENPLRTTILNMEPRLKATLPNYMVPSAYIPLTRLPKTLSCKKDRRKLRELGSMLSTTQLAAFLRTRPSSDRPLTETEQRIRSLWVKVLKVNADDIGTTDDFFRLGGDSIGAMRFVTIARAEGISVTVQDVLGHPQLSELSTKAETTTAVTKPIYRPFKFLKASAEDWFLRDVVCPQLLVDISDIEDVLNATDYQVSALSTGVLRSRGGTNYITLDFAKPLIPEQLELACARLVAHHEILRTVYLVHRGRVQQVVLKTAVRKIAQLECIETVEDMTVKLMDDDIRQSVSISDLMPQFTILRQHERAARLIVRVSHAQYDGPSLIRMCKDLSLAYTNKELVPTLNFPEYASFTGQSAQDKAETFWRNLLIGSKVTEIIAHSRPPYKNVLDGAVKKLIPTSSMQCHGITTATIVKAAWSYVLLEMSGQTDVVFGSTTWGRNLPFDGIENVVGPCMDHIPVRVQFGSVKTVLNLLEQVHSQYVAAVPFECLGFRRIVRRCTDWRPWERLNSVVLYQNLDEGVNSLSVDKSPVHLGEIRPPADRADIAVYIEPQGSDTLINLDFCTEVIPMSLVQELLEKLCFHIQDFCKDVNATLKLPEKCGSTLPRFPIPPRRLQNPDMLPSNPATVHSSPSLKRSADRLNTNSLYNINCNDEAAKKKQRQSVAVHQEDVLLQPSWKHKHLQKIVEEAWKFILCCERSDLVKYREISTPYFEVWGSHIATYGLARSYCREGFEVTVEDVIESPTIALQVDLLGRSVPREP
ncbi:hypothetical protein MMC18_006705 [Xylographa bjoerkii]|nr:hypothetical protein [Xylographa bjoerkii]